MSLSSSLSQNLKRALDLGPDDFPFLNHARPAAATPAPPSAYTTPSKPLRVHFADGVEPSLSSIASSSPGHRSREHKSPASASVSASFISPLSISSSPFHPSRSATHDLEQLLATRETELFQRSSELRELRWSHAQLSKQFETMSAAMKQMRDQVVQASLETEHWRTLASSQPVPHHPFSSQHGDGQTQIHQRQEQDQKQEPSSAQRPDKAAPIEEQMPRSQHNAELQVQLQELERIKAEIRQQQQQQQQQQLEWQRSVELESQKQMQKLKKPREVKQEKKKLAKIRKKYQEKYQILKQRQREQPSQPQQSLPSSQPEQPPQQPSRPGQVAQVVQQEDLRRPEAKRSILSQDASILAASPRQRQPTSSSSAQTSVQSPFRAGSTSVCHCRSCPIHSHSISPKSSSSLHVSSASKDEFQQLRSALARVVEQRDELRKRLDGLERSNEQNLEQESRASPSAKSPSRTQTARSPTTTEGRDVFDVAEEVSRLRWVNELADRDRQIEALRAELVAVKQNYQMVDRELQAAYEQLRIKEQDLWYAVDQHNRLERQMAVGGRL